MHRSIRSRFALSLPVLALLVSAASHQPSANPTQVAGTISLTGKPNDHPEQGAGGALIFIGESKGSNQNTGQPAFMDGAVVVSADTVSLVNGNGTHQGVLIMSKGSDKVAFKWSGQVTTRLGEDKKPDTNFQGTWTAIDGASGSGTYEGRFTPPVASEIHWKGELGK